MAFEENRYRAAVKSRHTGQATITAPITLVQDNNKMPGFLFFAPFYAEDNVEPPKGQRDGNGGLVYAPFIVNKLMEGALERQKRHVGIRLIDDGEILYDEHVKSEPDYDPNPQFKRTITASIYNRSWEFDIWSAKSFRVASTSSQPLLILAGGILIDGLLLMLFITSSRSSRASRIALNISESMTQKLQTKATQLAASQKLTAKRAEQLELSNEDLKHFASIASHDLQEPLRKVASFCSLLRDEYGEQLGDEGRQYTEFAVDGATRMRLLVQDLLAYSKVGSHQNARTSVDTNAALQLAIENLETAIVESEAVVTYGDLPSVLAEKQDLCQLFQNLIGNSIKYCTAKPPRVHVTAISSGDDWKFSIADNGIGIEPEYCERVFGIFKRLHTKKKFSGTGIGLAICKRVVDGLHGKIWVEPKSDPGCTICFTIPKQRTPFNPEGTTNELERNYVSA